MMAFERFDAGRAPVGAGGFSRTDRWPRSELYGVTSQVRKAVLSMPTNLAEGAAKTGEREFERFLHMSLGSRSELA